MDCDKRTLENIPPKQEALLRSSRRALHQAGYICRKALEMQQNIQSIGMELGLLNVLQMSGLCIVATLQSIMLKKHNLIRGIANVLMLI